MFELNEKWHICLFLLGLQICCWDTKRPETLLCVVLCAHWVTINLYFRMSKSASCLSGKDIHSIFVSQMILQRCCFSTTHAPHSPSNQVCEVAEQRSKLIDLTLCWGIGRKQEKTTTPYSPQSTFEQKDTCREMHVAYGILFIHISFRIKWKPLRICALIILHFNYYAFLLSLYWKFRASFHKTILRLKWL